MQINYWAILVCGVLAMVLGVLWYGPLFGKAWARIIGADMSDPEARKKMQKGMGPMYLLQFVLALFQIWVLSTYSLGLGGMGSLINAVWIWIGFVMPTTAGSCMWNNDSRKHAWQKFFIQSGYQLLCFIVFGLIIGLWQ